VELHNGLARVPLQRFRAFFHPPPLPLVRDGKLLWRNVRREFITKEELMSQIRTHGFDDISVVKRAQMAGDGRITIIGYNRPPNSS
jgi:uncharacterized membrane protein YcaP (DUF421 family)